MSNKRYYILKNGELRDEVLGIKRTNLQTRKDLFQLSKEVGASGYYADGNGKGFQGFIFENVDKTKFKGSDKNGWYPKKNTKWGKELSKRIDGIVSRFQSEINVIQDAGLNAASGEGIEGGRLYIMFPSVQILFFSDHFGDESVVFVIVPEKQKEGWAAPDFLDEIREWEYLKILDEFNALLKK